MQDVRHHDGDARALLEALDQQRLGAGVVQQPLLGEDAHLEIDRPAVLRRQGQHAFQPAQADSRVHLHVRAHVRGSLQDRLLEGARGPRRDILRGEARFRRGHLRDRFLERLGAEHGEHGDAGLVEVHVRIDQAGREEAPAEVDLARAAAG